MKRRTCPTVRSRAIAAAVPLAMALALLVAGCVTTAEQCDPSDASFGQSFLCQGRYADRQQQLREQVEAAARRVTDAENEREDVEEERRRVSVELAELETGTQRALERILRLRSRNDGAERELLDMERRIEAMQRELAELEIERRPLEGAYVDEGVQTSLEELREEELELEELLQELES